jgi:hypothetical protein
MGDEVIPVPDHSQNLENEDQARTRTEASIESGGNAEQAAAVDNVNCAPKELDESAKVNEGNSPGDEEKVARAAEPPSAAASLARLLVPMDRATIAGLTEAERKARRWAIYSAKRKLERGH